MLGWQPASDKIKAKRTGAKKERDQKQNERKLESGLFTSPLVATKSGSGGTVDLEKRLEIEIELLGEMVVARKERLETLGKTQLVDDASDLEVLEKVE
ncbi:hypothetical protein N7530_006187 [Penicillium desertorum]|uniref:Uncharacterized protein n=1 Tax=Penicillium desertorum TaxID=1303715 RepID=A0A9W9WR65_9EURO|nr:hypothetical protein N7530_006187 [Penicillium desertorum]